MPTVCLIGHTDYSLKMRSTERSLPFGEVNNAKKLQKILKDGDVPVTDVLDVYELFEVNDIEEERGKLLDEMRNANISIGNSNIDFITDFNNSAAKAFHKNIAKALNHNDNVVLLFLTWAGRTLSMLSTGIQRKYPTIGKEDSYIHASKLPDHFPMSRYAKELSLLTSESLLGAENLKYYGVSLDKFIYLPNLAPPEAINLIKRSSREKKIDKERYLYQLAEKNKKNIQIDDNTIVIGFPSRFVRRKNIDMLIYAVAEIYKKHPYVLLVLKGNMDPEFDMFSQYSEKLYQLLLSALGQPWFLWDKESTPYPEVLKTYASFDICAHLSGAELGCNTVVEVCALGVPTLLVNASVNPFLYQGMTEFVKAEPLCESTWLYQQPVMSDLIEKLEKLIISSEKRIELGKKGEKLAEMRFGAHQQIERITLMTKAASSFFHQDCHVESYKQQILEKTSQDLKAVF